jgi:hypothetical protein
LSALATTAINVEGHRLVVTVEATAGGPGAVTFKAADDDALRDALAHLDPRELVDVFWTAIERARAH